MAPLAIAAAVVGTVGTVISTISQANALRSQADARRIEGEQQLSTTKKQLRQELGQAAVGVGASGLFGSSFFNVFESQAIEDAIFLGRIKQRTDFDVANLKQQARNTMVSGLISAGTGLAGGIAGAKGVKAQEEFLNRQTDRQVRERLRERQGQKSGNIFATGSPRSFLGPRRARTATFF